jgi:uncharacterized protein with ParB-like and HNH nuclease domain
MSIHSNEYNLPQVLSESGDLYVPWFQRDYTWDDENIDELFMDLFDEYSWENIFESSRTNVPLRDYFLGAVMLCGQGNSRRMILDGQQRLTTLSMLLACLLRKMSQHSQLEALRKEGTKILRNQNNENRLELKKGNEASPLESDQNVYSQIMEALHHNAGLAMDQNAADPLNFALQKRQIYNTFVTLSVKLDDQLALASKYRYSEADAIAQLYKIFTQNLIFVSIRTDDEDYAIKFFETLNARGAELRPDDLVKNALFLQANNSNTLRNLVVTKWDNFAQQLSEPGDRIDFLRFNWNSQRNFIGKSRVYKSYKSLFNEFNISSRINDFCEELIFSSDFYKSVINASGHYSFCRGLLLIGAKICRPVMLAVNKKFAHEIPAERRARVYEVVRILEAVMMRCAICEQVTTSLEKGFAQVAKTISESQDTWSVILSDIKSELTDPIYRVPDDEEFKNRLQNVVLHPSDLVKYKWRAFFATLDRFLVTPERIAIPKVSDIKLQYTTIGNAQYHQSVGNILTQINDAQFINAGIINPPADQLSPGNWNAANVASQKQRIINTALSCWSLE